MDELPEQHRIRITEHHVAQALASLELQRGALNEPIPEGTVKCVFQALEIESIKRSAVQAAKIGTDPVEAAYAAIREQVRMDPVLVQALEDQRDLERDCPGLKPAII